MDFPIYRWISLLARYQQMFMSRSLESLGLGHGQYPFILAVCKTPGISQDRLAEELFLNKSSVARAVAQLERGGFLDRQVDERDKRAYQIYPTQKAWGVREQVVSLSQQAAAGLTRDFTDGEREALNSLLQRMAQSAIAQKQAGIAPQATQTQERGEDHAAR